jgi:hypothetical protein
MVFNFPEFWDENRNEQDKNSISGNGRTCSTWITMETVRGTEQQSTDRITLV